MGLNISVYNRKSEELPGWDWIRYSGDRDFADLVGKLPPSVKLEENWAGPHDFEFYVRPIDFAAWRAAIAAREWPNPGRFERLMDMLEASPEFFIHFGW